MFDSLIDPPLLPALEKRRGETGVRSIPYTSTIPNVGGGKQKGKGGFKAARSMRGNCNCGYATEEGWHFGRAQMEDRTQNRLATP
jgi:hypothetical protein